METQQRYNMGGDEDQFDRKQKAHRPSKVDQKKKKEKPDTRGKNAKAFTVQNVTKVRFTYLFPV